MKPANDLERFTEAQENVYQKALQELKHGKKTSHWMWFIFPQIDGLGLSSTTKFYSIKSIREANDYLNHPILGQRLIECCNAILNIEGKTAEVIFGHPDNRKLQSCMTLFNFISTDENVFEKVLDKYFAGQQDKKTLEILNAIQGE